MKVLQVAPYFHPHVGGVESHVLDLSRKLAEFGFQIEIVTSMYERMKERERVFRLDVVRLKPIAIRWKTPITFKLRKYVASSDADIVHAHSPPPLDSYFAARACESSGKPFVITYHCDLEIPGILGPLIVWMYEKTFGSYTVSSADKIIVTTGTYAATSRTVWKYLPAVIPNAVDSKMFNPSLDGSEIREMHNIGNDEKLVLFVGRLVSHKGIEHLLDAAKLVSDARFVIVGGGEFAEEFTRRSHHLGTAGNVIFAGRVPYSDLPKYYAACDLSVLPSVSRLEAFGIAALEAMSSGRPVVVSDIPGVREVITDGEEGLLCEPMNPEDLAKKISLLLEDDATRLRMGSKGREKIEKCFDIGTVAKKVAEVYESLL
ncbi:MAG: glycosyltransferase family 4 protein [Thermoplasmata archaeon]